MVPFEVGWVMKSEVCHGRLLWTLLITRFWSDGWGRGIASLRSTAKVLKVIFMYVF